MYNEETNNDHMWVTLRRLFVINRCPKNINKSHLLTFMISGIDYLPLIGGGSGKAGVWVVSDFPTDLSFLLPQVNPRTGRSHVYETPSWDQTASKQ
jgi:hypothetical protein